MLVVAKSAKFDVVERGAKPHHGIVPNELSVPWSVLRDWPPLVARRRENRRVGIAMLLPMDSI